MHQTTGNTLRTFKAQNMVLDEENPWDDIFAFTIFALRATVHATTQYTLVQLIFGHDSIKNLRLDVDWETIRKRKQNLANEGNECKNRNRIKNAYKQGDKVRRLLRSLCNHSCQK